MQIAKHFNQDQFKNYELKILQKAYLLYGKPFIFLRKDEQLYVMDTVGRELRDA